MSLSLFLQLVIVGLVSGSIYGLIALGYTMVYGIIELINFAHGDIFMMGTMITIVLFRLLGVNDTHPPTGLALVGILILAFVVSMVACAVIGVVTERIAYRPLRNAPRLAPLISAIGVSLVLEDVGKLWNGLSPIGFPQIFPSTHLVMGPLQIDTIDIFIIVVAVLLMAGLQWLVMGTRLGRAMRAVAQDREAAALMGVNVDRIISVTFFIGAGLAGAAAVIYGLKFGTTVFYLGFTLGLIAFTAAVLGGIGNLVGAMLGSLIIGLVQAFAVVIPDSFNPASHGIGLPHGGGAWIEAIIFAILILILVFRPSGLLGQNVPDKV
ncbi:MAG TPA: branched-chain amino acid ABC transporter permease [Ktedonobacteraceae bacterium]|nr:branched-chain amino acid ABC transporter permease [Ktedonobacteraceae bacterium]